MIFKNLQKVFTMPRSVFWAILGASLLFIFIVLFPNWNLLKSLFLNNSVTLESKVTIPVLLLGSIFTNFSTYSALYVILISLLFGVYVGALVYFIRHRIKEISDNGISLGFLGAFTGFFGVGCAACGMFIFTNLSLVTLSGVTALLPGIIFQALGVFLLLTAIYQTLKKISDPLVCKV